MRVLGWEWMIYAQSEAVAAVVELETRISSRSKGRRRMDSRASGTSGGDAVRSRCVPAAFLRAAVRVRAWWKQIELGFASCIRKSARIGFKLLEHVAMDKAIKLATKPKRAAPKAKYIDPIVQGTFSQDGSLEEAIKSLTLRLRDQNTTVRALRRRTARIGSVVAPVAGNLQITHRAAFVAAFWFVGSDLSIPRRFLHIPLPFLNRNS